MLVIESTSFSSTSLSAKSWSVHLDLPSGGLEQARMTNCALALPFIFGGAPLRGFSFNIESKPSRQYLFLIRATDDLLTPKASMISESERPPSARTPVCCAQHAEPPVLAGRREAQLNYLFTNSMTSWAPESFYSGPHCFRQLSVFQFKQSVNFSGIFRPVGNVRRMQRNGHPRVGLEWKRMNGAKHTVFVDCFEGHRGHFGLQSSYHLILPRRCHHHLSSLGQARGELDHRQFFFHAV